MPNARLQRTRDAYQPEYRYNGAKVSRDLFKLLVSSDYDRALAQDQQAVATAMAEAMDRAFMEPSRDA